MITAAIALMWLAVSVMVVPMIRLNMRTPSVEAKTWLAGHAAVTVGIVVILATLGWP